MDRKKIENRFNDLKNEANSWVQAWKQLSLYIRPTRGFFSGDQPNRGKEIDFKTILDGHPGRASRILASGMTSGLTSPSRPWFKLGIPDNDLLDYEPVKIWLSQVRERMMTVFSKSNIYGALQSCYEEVGVFGTASMILLEDFNDVIRSRNFTIGEYYLGSGSDNRINSFAREYNMTVGQLVKEFGIEKCSLQTKNSYKEGKVDGWVKVFHLVEPNDDRISDRAGFQNMAFRSIYWENGSDQDTFLKVSGYEEFPVLAPRWDLTTTADVYGRGPGWDAVGDVRMLQKMQREKLKALGKVVDPPLQKDASVQDGGVNTLPGGVTHSSSSLPNAGVRTVYQINPDFQAIEMTIEKTKQAISEAFYSDLFLMLSRGENNDKTAREIAERHEEKLLVLGPVLERLESDLHDPLIDRTFQIMYRAGLIPPAPQELEGMDLKVEYISLLAQAQKMVGTAAIDQVTNYIGNVSKVMPEVLDNIDIDEAVNVYGDMLGVPPKVIRSKESVEKLRKERAKQIQQEKMAMAAQNAVQGAKTLADTKLNQGSALDALLGRQPGDQNVVNDLPIQ